MTSGTRDVTLTVTDDQGTSDSVVIPVSVVHINVAPTADFSHTCDDTDCDFDATGSSDSDGDRRLLRLGLRRRSDRGRGEPEPRLRDHRVP